MTTTLQFSIRPLVSRLLRKAGFTRPLPDYADEIVEISTSEVVSETPAIFLPNEPELIQKNRHNLDRETLLQTISGRDVRHGPTIAYRFKSALVLAGSIYAGSSFSTVSAWDRRPFFIGRCQEYTDAMMCADSGSELFFGRWLCDSLSKELLSRELELTPFNQTNPTRLHEVGYRSALQMEADCPTAAAVTNLWTVDDRGYNSHHMRRFKALRTRLRVSPLLQKSVGSPSLIYLARGSLAAPGREINNESEMIEELERTGFAILHPETMDAVALASVLHHARIVVAVEGSVLSHAVMAAPSGAALVTIQPSNRFSTAFKTTAEAAGLRFAFMIAEANPNNDSIAVDMVRLQKTIELAVKATC